MLTYSFVSLCQKGIKDGDYYSLGTYTNFKWVVTQLDPLEFEMSYDGGTLACMDAAVRYVMF